MLKIQNKFFLAVVLFIMFGFIRVPSAHASTQVSDDIIADTEWTMDGSPYVLTSLIQVMSGATLTIDPGVTVTYNGDFYPYQKEVGIIISPWSKLIVGSQDGARVHMDTVSIQSNSASMNIANTDLRGLVGFNSNMALNSMTMKSIWLSGSTATASKVSLLGDSTYESLVSNNSTLTMQDSTIDSVNPSLESLRIGATGKADLTNVTVRSKSTGIYMKGFALLLAHNVLIENCPIDGIMMKKVDPGVGSYDNHIFLVNTEIAGNGAGIEASDWPYFEMAGDSIHDNGIGFKYSGKAPFTVSVMHMQNNWWGDTSGPYNATGNSAGKGNAVADLTVFSPWLTSVPFPQSWDATASGGSGSGNTQVTDTTTAGGSGSTDTNGDGTTDTTSASDTSSQDQTETQTQTESSTTTVTQLPVHTPVLIVPGVLGTEIGDASGNKLWLDLFRTVTDVGDEFMDPLQFKDDLSPSVPNLNLAGVLGRETTIGSHTLFDYSYSLVQEFKDQGYVEDKDLFLFPYDWRSGVSEDVVSAFKQKISDIKKETGSPTVDIVAHSTGGLIVKRYVYENASNASIDKAVFVGVPNAGAPKALKALLVGDGLGVPFLADSEMKKIARNLPVVYDLAPSAKYYAAVGSYLSTVDKGFFDSSSTDLDFQAASDRLKTVYGLNTKALASEAILHTPDFDNYDVRGAGVDSYAIDGCTTGTIGKIAEIHSHDLLGEPVTGFGVASEVAGDGTVPFASATSLPVSHVYYALRGEHAEMLGEEGIRQEIVNILSGSGLSVDGKLVTQDISQCGLNGRFISIFSPLSIDITDAAGNHAGIASDGVSIEDTIPNADYEVFGDHKFVYLPTGSGEAYSIQLAGTGDGKFTLTDATLTDGKVLDTQVFSDMPVTKNLQGSLVLGAPDDLLLDSHDPLPAKDNPSTIDAVETKSSEQVFDPVLPHSGEMETTLIKKAEAATVPSTDTENGLAASAVESGATIRWPLWGIVMILTMVLSLFLLRLVDVDGEL